jgi:hypothetical protein
VFVNSSLGVKSFKELALVLGYSDPPNTRPSGIRMVIFRTLFGSGFQMVKGSHLVFTIRKPDKIGQKVTKPDKKSDFRMVGPFEIRTEVFLTSVLS